ncbi:phage terminase small subunit [Cohnella sp.]|uniref:phage terminase small subunit n=1 Tax=Cohnella sp. TaxID=1883426 RepID=UPI0037046D22
MSIERNSGRQLSPEYKKALKLFLKDRTMKPKDIAEKVGVSPEQVRKWKSLYKWETMSDPPRGAPRGNQNAKGNRGGKGGPLGNDHAVKHGAFRKFLPDDPEYLEILDMVKDMSALDMIYTGIENAFVALIRNEKTMFVSGKDEMIKEVKKQKFEIHSTGSGKEKKLHRKLVEQEWNFHFSYERYEKYAKTQASIYASLRAGIKQFLNLAPEDDERRARIALIEAQTERTRAQIEEIKDGDKDNPSEIHVRRWSRGEKPSS